MNLHPIVCGKIGKSFGFEGAFHFYPHSSDFSYLLSTDKLYFQQPDQSYLALSIKSIRNHQDHLIIQFDSIKTREALLPYVNQPLYIDKSTLPALNAGQYYWHDLQGCSVYNQNGLSLGTVISLYFNGAQDVLVINDNLHIPYLWKNTVYDVDIEMKKIIVCFDYEEWQE